MDIIERINLERQRLAASHVPFFEDTKDENFNRLTQHESSESDVKRALYAALHTSDPDVVRHLTPVYIDAEMMSVILHASASYPMDQGNRWSPNMLPFPHALVVGAEPFAIEPQSQRAITHITWSYDDSMIDQRFCVWATWRARKGRQLLYPAYSGLIADKQITDMHGDQSPNHMHIWRVMLTLWMMLQQRIAVKEPREPNRAQRRRVQKEGGEPLATVTVIRLRRPSLPSGAEDTAHPGREWTHRWMVDGHWRNQYLPSVDAHRQTWIAPYIKGPDDKPVVMKDRIYTFVR